MIKNAKVWALSDFHLPGNDNKTMDKFGSAWKSHPARIYENVTKLCNENDVLLVGGDISWALKIEGALNDLKFIESLKCMVVLSEGNHDCWASKYNAVIANLPKNVFWVQRGCKRIGNIAVVSTRLWDFDCVVWPDYIKTKANSDPKKIERRELLRLEKALKELPQDSGIIRILMVHFPPVGADGERNELTDIINGYNVDYCVYGHLHGVQEKTLGTDVKIGQTRFLLTSSDWLGMKPIEICNYNPDE